MKQRQLLLKISNKFQILPFDGRIAILEKYRLLLGPQVFSFNIFKVLHFFGKNNHENPKRRRSAMTKKF